MKNSHIITAQDVRDVMAESYRRSNGQTVTVALPGATVGPVPAFLSVDRVDINGDTRPERVNVGATVLGAIAYHTDSWGVSERRALGELAQRWEDMVSDPNAPSVDLVAIQWVLDLDTLATGSWAE